MGKMIIAGVISGVLVTVITSRLNRGGSLVRKSSHETPQNPDTMYF